MIKIRFVTQDEPISRAIRLAEYGFWCSHTEAVMPDGTLLGAHADGGVQARTADYDAGKWTKQLIVGLPCSDSCEARFLAFVREQVGKPYDFDAIAAIVAQRNWDEPDSWFCSEMIAAALQVCGYFATPLAAAVAKITPRDLLLILSGRVPIPEIQLAA